MQPEHLDPEEARVYVEELEEARAFAASAHPHRSCQETGRNSLNLSRAELLRVLGMTFRFSVLMRFRRPCLSFCRV